MFNNNDANAYAAQIGLMTLFLRGKSSGRTEDVIAAREVEW